MSRIYDAVRTARESRPHAEPGSSDCLGQMEFPERRITPRMELATDLAVYGHFANGGTFYERVKSINGNANGGLFEISIPVSEGQELLLINNGTSEEQICNVVRVHIRDMQTSEVSVSFPLPNFDFWKVA